jgi:APA family basic amino acid/polyamine antiporter
VVAPLGIGVNLTMMLFLPWATWLRLGAWLLVGLVIYFVYSRQHSRIASLLAGAPEAKSAPRPVLASVDGGER